MNTLHGMDWAPLVPAFKLLGSWSWLGLGAAAVVAAHVALIPSENAACPSAAEAPFDDPICLGDGAMLDPATSLIWRTRAPGANCADVDPVVAWRTPTHAEISGIGRESLRDGAPAHEALCVNDTLARLQP
jgi:hypothetical protein